MIPWSSLHDDVTVFSSIEKKENSILQSELCDWKIF